MMRHCSVWILMAIASMMGYPTALVAAERHTDAAGIGMSVGLSERSEIASGITSRDGSSRFSSVSSNEFFEPLLAEPSLPVGNDSQLLAQNSSPLTVVRRFNHGNNVNALTFSNDGQWLATTGGDRKIRVWNVDALLQGDERNQLARVINIPEADRYVTSLTFAPERRWLVASTYNGDVRVWDLNACDPDYNTCASDVLSERNYRGVDPMVRFHPRNGLLAGSNYDGTVTLWDWQTRATRNVLEAETGAHNGDRIDGRFSSIDFSPSGRFLVAGSHDKTLTFWDFEEELEQTLVLETAYGVDAVAFSPTVEQVANANLRGIELRSFRYSGGRLRIEDEVVLENHGRVNTILFSPDGRYLLSGDNNGDIALWDVEEEEMLINVPPEEGHSRAVLEIAYDTTRNLFASGSADGSIIVWRLTP